MDSLLYALFLHVPKALLQQINQDIFVEWAREGILIHILVRLLVLVMTSMFDFSIWCSNLLVSKLQDTLLFHVFCPLICSSIACIWCLALHISFPLHPTDLVLKQASWKQFSLVKEHRIEILGLQLFHAPVCSSPGLQRRWTCWWLQTQGVAPTTYALVLGPYL